MAPGDGEGSPASIPLKGYQCIGVGPNSIASLTPLPSPQAALLWCLAVQECAIYAEWPHSAMKFWAAERDSRDRILFRGPRLKMGVCEGSPASIMPDHLGRADYHGASVNQAARIMDAGQLSCACSEDLRSLIFSASPALHLQARTLTFYPSLTRSRTHSLCAGAHGGQIACEEDLAARVLRRLERLLIQSDLPQLQPLQHHSGPLEEANQFSQPLFGLLSAPLPHLRHSASLPRVTLPVGGTATGDELFCGDVQRSNASSSSAVGIRIPLDEARANDSGSPRVRVPPQSGLSGVPAARLDDSVPDSASAGGAGPYCTTAGSQELSISVAAARESAASSSRTEISARMPSMDGSVHSSYTDGRAPSMSEMAPGGGSITGRTSPAWKLPSENVIQGLSVDVLAVRIGQFRWVQPSGGCSRL